LKPLTRALRAIALGLAITLLSVPLTAQGPADPYFCRVEHVPGVPADPGIGVSKQAVRERADPNEMYFIDILFFYTDGFADDFTRLGHSMSNQIWQSVSLLNAALANSKVNATFRIVGIEQLPGMPDDQDIAIQMIVENEQARRRRNALGADLVYALVDDRAGFLGTACEPHSEAGFNAESCFWGSVNNFCGGGGLGCDDVWRTVLRHEVGHNLGIQHSPDAGGDPNGGFRKGAVGYSSPLPNTDPEWYGTVMGANWLPRFSTSSERYHGLVVGEPGVHEASTALQYSIVAVSKYRESVVVPRKTPPLQPGEHTDCIPQSTPLTLGLHLFENPAGRYRDGYRVSMCYETYDGKVGDGNGGLFSFGESGLLWFFDRGNAEVLIKVLNGCGVNGHRWVYVAPVTDLAFNLHIDGLDGSRWTYRNPLGTTAPARSDTSAFACSR